MNVLKPDKKSTIITLLNNGISQREISRKTKINRKTVSRYANDLFPGNGDLDSKYPTKGEVATGSDCIISQNAPPGHRERTYRRKKSGQYHYMPDRPVNLTENGLKIR